MLTLTYSLCFQMESAVSAPVSGHIKRVAVHEGMSLLFTKSAGYWNRADALPPRFSFRRLDFSGRPHCGNRPLNKSSYHTRYVMHMHAGHVYQAAVCRSDVNLSRMYNNRFVLMYLCFISISIDIYIIFELAKSAVRVSFTSTPLRNLMLECLS